MQPVIPFILSLLAFLLVMSGILGIAVNLVNLVNLLLGKIWSMEIRHIITAIPIIVGAIVLFNYWSDIRLHKDEASLIANILLLLMMAAGGYFLYLYISTGSLTYQPPF